jgi:hypothetical protein
MAIVALVYPPSQSINIVAMAEAAVVRVAVIVRRRAEVSVPIGSPRSGSLATGGCLSSALQGDARGPKRHASVLLDRQSPPTIIAQGVAFSSAFQKQPTWTH